MAVAMNDISVSPGPSGPIAVRITSISQLFNSFDPFPFQERDLDEKAEEFIVGWARECRAINRSISRCICRRRNWRSRNAGM